MKIAVVTGGSSGIGKATVLALAKRGIGVIFTYNSRKNGADTLVQEIEQNYGVRAVAIKLDLNAPTPFDTFAEAVKKNLVQVWDTQTFDYLVNNAGMGGAMMAHEVTEAHFEQMINANFKGAVFVTRHLLPMLADAGAILNVASTSAKAQTIGFSIYGATKAALVNWSKYLAKELAPRKIRVNSVSPGPTHTNFSDSAFDKYPEYIQPLADETALGRLGRPEDFGPAIAHFLSDDFAWMTAQDVEISGGHRL
jgi:NAD(P)-dependent dehydrogenase (short-subunit alcohol dehydrogenase family)